jgi:hypothetical protein
MAISEVEGQMKLRIARKILNSYQPDIGCDPRYRSSTIERALARDAKTATTKEVERYTDWWMKELGPLGRSELVFRWELREVAAKHRLGDI